MEKPDTISLPRFTPRAELEKRIDELFGEGKSYSAIARCLNAEGLRAERQLCLFTHYSVRASIEYRTRPDTGQRTQKYRGVVPPCEFKKTLAYIADLLATGFDHNQISNALNSHNYRTDDGSLWTGSAVRTIEHALLREYRRGNPRAYHAECAAAPRMVPVPMPIPESKPQARSGKPRRKPCTEIFDYIDKDSFGKLLSRAANAAAHKFRNCIPTQMRKGDFAQEIIVKMYSEVTHWKDTGKKTLEQYALSTAFNRARDILRQDMLHNAVEVTDDMIVTEARKCGIDPEHMTARQEKDIRTGLRMNIVESFAEFHKEPATIDPPESDWEEELAESA